MHRPPKTQLAHRLQETQKEYDYHSDLQSMDPLNLGDIFVQSPDMQQENSGFQRLQQVWRARARMESTLYGIREISLLLSILEDLRDQ